MSKIQNIINIIIILSVLALVGMQVQYLFNDNIIPITNKTEKIISVDSIVSVKEREYRRKIDSINTIHNNEIRRLNKIIYDLRTKKDYYDSKLGVWPEF